MRYYLLTYHERGYKKPLPFVLDDNGSKVINTQQDYNSFLKTVKLSDINIEEIEFDFSDDVKNKLMGIFLGDDGYETGLVKLIGKIKLKDIDSEEFKKIYFSRINDNKN